MLLPAIGGERRWLAQRARLGTVRLETSLAFIDAAVIGPADSVQHPIYNSRVYFCHRIIIDVLRRRRCRDDRCGRRHGGQGSPVSYGLADRAEVVDNGEACEAKQVLRDQVYVLSQLPDEEDSVSFFLAPVDAEQRPRSSKYMRIEPSHEHVACEEHDDRYALPENQEYPGAACLTDTILLAEDLVDAPGVVHEEHVEDRAERANTRIHYPYESQRIVGDVVLFMVLVLLA